MVFIADERRARAKALGEQLESIIDLHGLTSVVQSLADICGQKEEHLLSNWQDKRAAKKWRSAADRFDRLSAWCAATGPA